MELLCGDDPGAWAALGFAVGEDGAVDVGGVRVRCDGTGGGLRGWVLQGAGADAVDGIPTSWTEVPGTFGAPEHPNRATAIDHVVVFTDSRDRTAAALVAAGGDERRRMSAPEVPAPMAFVRLGGAIVEVAEGIGPTRLWGLVAIVEDLEALVASYGALLGEPRDAVQPGRRIVTVRRESGLETALAFMTPRVRR